MGLGWAERLTKQINPPLTSNQKARRRGQLPPSVQEWTALPLPQAIPPSPHGSLAPWPSPAAPGTHVWMSISEEFVKHMAELPAEDSVAREGQPVDNRPKGLCPFLMVGAQYAR